MSGSLLTFDHSKAAEKSGKVYAKAEGKSTKVRFHPWLFQLKVLRRKAQGEMEMLIKH